MKNRVKLAFCVLFISLQCYTSIAAHIGDIVSRFIYDTLNTAHIVVFVCNHKDAIHWKTTLQLTNIFSQIININSDYNLQLILPSKATARTSIFLNCNCNMSVDLISSASDGHYFNKTYNWILFDEQTSCLRILVQPKIKYFGPNAQLIHIAQKKSTVVISDVHSKGRHLNYPLEVIKIATLDRSFNSSNDLIKINDVQKVQGLTYRDNFMGLKLRAVTVIDQDNITSLHQINDILSRRTKDTGVAAFTKYHYELVKIMQNRLNFTVNFRNARGWAGRLGNSSFRLGFLGILKRNEADIGASAAFNRLNRFAEFDTVHQSWKFETSFIYIFTPNAKDMDKSGNFLAPFGVNVWFAVLGMVFMLNCMWIFIEYILCLSNTKDMDKTNIVDMVCAIPLNVVGAICQQGVIARSGTPCRIIVITTFAFTMVLYNYYTSSVVGGLLSNTAQGPTTVEQITSSKLRVSFEDIGYYKVLFRENKTPRIVQLFKNKVLPVRGLNDLPVYSNIDDAIPFLKIGGYAFHCEVADAYPEIAKQLDDSEICNLRTVSGLMDTELMNWIVLKNSQYTEMFRIIMSKAKEVGLIERLLSERQPKKPICRGLYTVYPVDMSGTSSALVLLLGMIEANWADIMQTLQERNELNRINDIQLNNITEIISVLEPFQEAFKKLEGEKYPTIHLVYIYAHYLKKKCNNSPSDSDFTAHFKNKLLENIEKILFNNLKPIHKLAIFFIPTNKKNVAV